MAIALAASALVGGCGGDDRLSKTQYLERFRAASRQALAEGETNEAGSSLAQKAVAAERSVGIIRRLASNVDALKAPKDVEAAQGDFVAAVRAQADELDRTVVSYRAGDSKPLEARFRVGGPSREIAERQEHAIEEFKEKGYPVASD